MNLNNWQVGDEVVLPTELGALEGVVQWIGHTSSMTVAGTRVAGSPGLFKAEAWQRIDAPGVLVHGCAMCGVEVEVAFPGAPARRYTLLVPSALLRRPKCEHCKGTGERGRRG